MATTEIYPLSLHDALPISAKPRVAAEARRQRAGRRRHADATARNARRPARATTLAVTLLRVGSPGVVPRERGARSAYTGPESRHGAGRVHAAQQHQAGRRWRAGGVEREYR